MTTIRPIRKTSISGRSQSRKKLTVSFDNSSNKTKTRRMEMKVDVNPGKKGGKFNLVEGVTVNIPENVLPGKKDSITCVIVPANNRQEFCPHLSEQEKLISNIIMLVSKPLLPEPIEIEFSYLSSHNPQIHDLRLMNRDGAGVWNEIEEKTVTQKSVQFSSTELGVFLILSSPKSESVCIDPNGGLYNFKIHHLMSLRVPKRGYQSTNTCRVRIIPVHEHRIARARKFNTSACMDVLNISPFYDFDFPEVELRRSATIKLPLPLWATGDEIGENAIDAEHFVVMQKWKGHWEALDANLKFTKNSVSFDSKTLSRFCMAKLKDPSRKSRAKLAMPIFLEYNTKIIGEVLLFALLEERKWHLWAECVPAERVVDTISDRVQKRGFTFLKKIEEKNEEETEVNHRHHRTRKIIRRPSVEEEEARQRQIKFYNGCLVTVKLDGAFKLRGLAEINIQFHEAFEDNHRCFEIEPTSVSQSRAETVFAERQKKEEEAAVNGDVDNEEEVEDVVVDPEVFNGEVQCYLSSELENEESVVVSKHALQIDYEDMKDYLSLKPLPPEPEPVPEPEVVEEIRPETPPPDPKPASKPLPPGKRPLDDAFGRLTAPKKNTVQYARRIQVNKEPKVLSGRSLQVLSKELNQGLTLAVHLNLPDSVITGIGFDSLSQGLSLSEVTYKILLFWKRTTKDKQSMVPTLVEALKLMNRNDMAAILMDRHRQNVELSPGCFSY